MPAATCPHCRETLDIPPELSGREVRCSSCGNVFVVPTEPGGPPLVPVRVILPQYYSAALPPQPRSDRGVWLLLFFTFMVAGGITAGCAGFYTWTMNPKITPVVDAEKRFKLEMPGEPRGFRIAADVGQGSNGYESTRPISDERYILKYFDLPADADVSDTQAVLNKAVQREASGSSPGPESSRQVTTHDGYPALDVWFENGELLWHDTTIVRAILIDRRVYLLVAKGKNLEPRMWWVMRFFKSFEVAEGAAPEPKNIDKK